MGPDAVVKRVHQITDLVLRQWRRQKLDTVTDVRKYPVQLSEKLVLRVWRACNTLQIARQNSADPLEHVVKSRVLEIQRCQNDAYYLYALRHIRNAALARLLWNA